MQMCLAPAASAYVLSVAIDDEDNRPYEYADDQGHLTGYHVELVREVSQKLGWSSEIHAVPWNRAQAMLARGETTAVTYLAKTPERDKYAIFLPGNVLHAMDIALYASRDRLAEIRYRPPFADMVQHWHFGFTQGYAYSEEIDAALHSSTNAENVVVTQPQLLSMLALRRVDVAVVMDSDAAVDQARRSVPDIETLIAPIEGGRFPGASVYVAFTRIGDGPERAAAFSQEYARWRASPAYGLLKAQFHLAPSAFSE